jgi:hypothetical protein
MESTLIFPKFWDYDLVLPKVWSFTKFCQIYGVMSSYAQNKENLFSPPNLWSYVQFCLIHMILTLQSQGRR